MRHDIKIKRLINKYGLEGYGLYNLIIESITEKLTTQSPIPDLQETCEDIAEFYNGNTTKVNEIVCFMINQGLLELDELSTRITCHKLYKFLEANQTRSKEIREMIKQYKTQIDCKSLPVLDCQETVSDKSEEKNRIEKNRKEKKIAYRDNIYLTEKEFNNLVNDYTKDGIEKVLDYFSSYKQEKSYKTKSDNLTIRRWVADACKVYKKEKFDINKLTKQEKEDYIYYKTIPGRFDNGA
jgi:hypothetical protein